MPSLGAFYFFLLGFAAGVALLTTTSYRRVSPGWLRWLLMISGLLVMSRYVMSALLVLAATPISSGWVRAGWCASAIGLTLPAFFAIDQLLKHPAMTPAKLLRWYAPFVALYGAALLVGDFMRMLAVITFLFSAALLVAGLFLLRRVPVWSIRRALLLLIVAYLGVAGETVAEAFIFSGGFIYSELLALLALWHAYETSATLQSGA